MGYNASFRVSSVWLTSLVLCGLLGLALPQAHAEPLADAEQALLGQNYPGDSEEARLSRLEQLVYGSTQEGTLAARTRQLNQVLKDFMLPETPNSSESAQAPADHAPLAEAVAPLETALEPDATDYPAVTEMEKKLFQRTYEAEAVSKRLVRLEEQVFHQTYAELPMVDRVDQLSLKVQPNSPLAKEETGIFALPKNSQELVGSNLAIYSQLTSLEEAVLNHSFGGELIPTRLTRLERHFYGSPQKGSIDDRLARLQARAQQPGSPFASPMIAQQSPSPWAGPVQPYTPGTPGIIAAPPQQPVIRYGNPIYSWGQPGQRLYGNGTVIGIPGQQIYTTPPANIPRQQLQPYSMYTNPGRRYGTMPPGNVGPVQPYVPQQLPSQQQQPFGPVWTPNSGSTNPMTGLPLGSFATPPIRPMPASMPAVNPVSQSVTLLEVQVFGRSYDGQNLHQRIGLLEQQLFGKTYPYYSFEQRVNRLMHAAPFRQG